MKINLSYIKYEFKKMLSDPLIRFMMIYPIVFGIVGRYLVPLIEDSSDMNLVPYYDIIIVSLTLMTPLVYGAIIGFSLLEDRDDNIFRSIKVSPLSINGYILFKVLIVFILSFIACTYVMWFSNIGNLGIGNIILISFLASLSAPFTGLLINAFASNKIEGFAIMKGTGIIILFPIVALLFTDYKEFFFAFAPGYWPAKVISSIIKGKDTLILSYAQYYIIGLIYIIILNGLTYKLFIRKTQI